METLETMSAEKFRKYYEKSLLDGNYKRINGKWCLYYENAENLIKSKIFKKEQVFNKYYKTINIPTFEAQLTALERTLKLEKLLC